MKKKKQRKKQHHSNPITTSLCVAFPGMPKNVLNGVADEVGRKMSGVWNGLRAGGSDSSVFGQFYAYTAAILDELPNIAQKKNIQFACRTGCSHCCKSEEINASFEEILNIASHMTEFMDEEQAISLQDRLSSYSKTKSLPGDGEPGSPCAFLVDDRCSIYLNRPMACRSYHSADENDCSSLLNGGPRRIKAIPHGRAYENTFWSITKPFKVNLFEINSVFKYLSSDQEIWNGLWKGTTDEQSLVDAGIPYITFRNRIPISLI